MIPGGVRPASCYKGEFAFNPSRGGDVLLLVITSDLLMITYGGYAVCWTCTLSCNHGNDNIEAYMLFFEQLSGGGGGRTPATSSGRHATSVGPGAVVKAACLESRSLRV